MLSVPQPDARVIGSSDMDAARQLLIPALPRWRPPRPSRRWVSVLHGRRQGHRRHHPSGSAPLFATNIESVIAAGSSEENGESPLLCQVVHTVSEHVFRFAVDPLGVLIVVGAFGVVVELDRLRESDADLGRQGKRRRARCTGPRRSRARMTAMADQLSWWARALHHAGGEGLEHAAIPTDSRTRSTAR